jgi:hypothetical protein
MIKNHKVDRKERITVSLALKFPDPHLHKSYTDPRRHYTVKIDVGETIKVDKEETIDLNVKLRALIVVKKVFGNKIDSSLTYRVGENFALLRINVHTLRISLSFADSNVLEILDNSSHILNSRILEKTSVGDE